MAQLLGAGEGGREGGREGGKVGGGKEGGKERGREERREGERVGERKRGRERGRDERREGERERGRKGVRKEEREGEVREDKVQKGRCEEKNSKKSYDSTITNELHSTTEHNRVHQEYNTAELRKCRTCSCDVLFLEAACLLHLDCYQHLWLLPAAKAQVPRRPTGRLLISQLPAGETGINQ